MNVYRSFDEIPFNSETVLTVGTYDGVHNGHQVIIRRLLEIAKRDNLRNVMLTLDPHPRIVLKKSGSKDVKLLTLIEERIKLFEKFGIENVLVIPFNYEFSQTPAEVFVREFLAKKIGLKTMLIGYDHMFGKDRRGDDTLLSRISRELNFSIEIIDPFKEKEITISSSKIRKAIGNSEIELANDLLGYNYFVSGKVIKGDGRGAKIGVPTANIGINSDVKLMPANGVYLAKVIIEEKEYYGMANIGKRPTFKDDDESTLEINIFNFNKNIYDLHLEVQFLKYLRAEKKFDGVEELLTQLDLDKIICQEIIKTF